MTNHIREHIKEYGVQALSTVDLLALVLRTDATRRQDIQLAEHLLDKYGGLSALAHTDWLELLDEPGLGFVVLTRLKVMLELAKRMNKPSPEKYQIKTSTDAARYLMPDLSGLDHEEMRVLVLDTKGYVLDNILLYRGTVNSSVVRTAEILRVAIVRKAVGIILCHCHPSGNTAASDEDVSVTKQVLEACRLVDIELMDHLIIGNGRYHSIRSQVLW
jgi:DNA repair protein RadC